MVMQELKNIASMKDFMHEFPRSGQLTLDPFTCTLFTSKAFLLVKKYCCFFLFEKDVWCSEKLMPSLLEAYASQLHSQASELTDNEYLMEAVRVY